MTALILGPVAFKDFEIPSQIDGLGGRQMMHVHKLVGGRRVVDAMGPDPHDKVWAGRFRGADAESRAHTLESLAQRGAMIPLSFGSFYYLVVIADFHATYEKAQEIPYDIRCTVVIDGAAGLIGSLIGIAASATALVASDIAQLGALAVMLSAATPVALGGTGPFVATVLADLVTEAS